MDRLQTMSVFVAVAEEAGFAPAARRLNTSPPSVTRAVSELETRLGARLLHRTTRSVQLTDAGHRYLADCRSHGELYRITDRLLGSGWDEADIARLLGGNFLRAFRANWG